MKLRDESGGRILLGDNRSGGAVMLRPIRFQCDGVFTSTGLPCICIYTWGTVDLVCTQIRLAPGLPGSYYCVCRGVSDTLVSMSSSELDLENISLCNKECVRQPDDT